MENEEQVVQEQEQKQEEAPKTKKSFKEFLESHPKSVFWTRFAAFISVGLIAPISFIAYKFELFQTISKVQISGWGILIIIFVAAFILGVTKYVKVAMSAKYTLLGQILSGFMKVILPLMVALILIGALQKISKANAEGMEKNIENITYVLSFTLGCEMVAIPMNPLPKWANDMQKDVEIEKRKSATDYLLTEYFKRKKAEDGKQ